MEEQKKKKLKPSNLASFEYKCPSKTVTETAKPVNHTDFNPKWKLDSSDSVSQRAAGAMACRCIHS